MVISVQFHNAINRALLKSSNKCDRQANNKRHLISTKNPFKLI